MKLIHPSTEILHQQNGISGIFKQIEIAGRTCYKSHDKITEDSAKKFADAMIKSGHGAMLEHGTVYLRLPSGLLSLFFSRNLVKKYMNNPYSRVNEGYEMITSPCSNENNIISFYAVTTNYRVLAENGWLDDLRYLCEPTSYHEKRISVRFYTDIGVTREANRHRANSPAEQSTRYCNYSKEKFGNELSVALPIEFTEEEVHNSEVGFSDPSSDLDCFHSMCQAIGEYDEDIFDIVSTWLFANLACEWSYMRLIKLGWKPQQARRVLPLDTHSELVHTAFVSDWKHFFDLRALGTTGAPHPDMLAVALPLYKQFISLGYIKK